MISFHLQKICEKTKQTIIKLKTKQNYEILIETEITPDIPKVPIKTYRWEDVRRSRKTGAYPWTHLTKPPFDDEENPDEYSMDAFRRSHSASTLGKSETQEIDDDVESKETHQQGDVEEKENTYKHPESDSGKKELIKISLRPLQNNDNQDRAKSEEPAKKRKLSIDSSYSRVSLPKLRIMERLKSAKGKLKLPTLTKRARPDLSTAKEVKKQKAPAITPKETVANEKSLYIHIPLKPPPGETDEFSKYEFESPSHSISGSLTNISQIPEKKRKTSLLGILTQIKIAHDQHVGRPSQPSDEVSRTTKAKVDSETGSCIQEVTTEEQTEEDTHPPTIEIEENGSTSHTALEESGKSNKLTVEEVLEEKEESQTPDVENSSLDDNISQYLDKDEQYEVISEVKSNTNELSQPSAITLENEGKFKPDPENLRKLEGALSKWKKQVPAATKLELPNKDALPVRAHSEEPKRKRRTSIDSSYSRKSLSKINFMKKLKQAKEKFKLAHFPSFSKFDKKDAKKKNTKIETVVESKKKLKPAEPEKAVYIHIPLKPPPGQTDEFSHLVDEPRDEEKKIKHKMKDKLETPEADTDTEDNVQLIILTPPSDDEVLDGPETPSETDKKFFENLKIDDLKTLAKNAVNTVYPEPRTLETVKEDESGDSQENEDVKGENTEEPTVPQKHQILIDEEDGLKLSDVAIAMINEELEKEYNEQAMGLKSIIKNEMSPVLKKKVAFKRKSCEDVERIYEDVQLSKAPNKNDSKENVVAHSVVIPLQSFQSNSVDEEKSYLDKQIIKTTSLEEDYNKWSQSNDHEYEPIEPPPEVVTIRNPPIIHDNASPTELLEGIKRDEPKDEEDDDQPVDIEVIQRNMEENFFKKTSEAFPTLPKSAPKKEEGKPKEKAKKSPGKKFNETLRTHAHKLKSKMQNIKKPNISLPRRPKLPTTKLRKPNFKKPNIKMPKLPERPTINLPTFNFTRKNSKDSWRQRQLSTESNAGDSKKKIFDFRTFPRMFDRAKKEKQEDETSTLPPEFATIPRTSKTATIAYSWPKQQAPSTQKNPDIIRIPLHPEEDVEQDRESFTEENIEAEDEDDYKPENDEPLINQELLKRWEHGQFHEKEEIPYEERHEEYNTDNYRSEEPDDTQIMREDSFDITPPKEHSLQSLNEHRRGVLEEIDSDEFFLREKGISQDDIEVGKYLSSEIREAFRNPISQFQSEDREYDLELSDQSEPIRETSRRKPLKKPKRKKTPHVSREQISFDQESNTEPEEYPNYAKHAEVPEAPVRPKRRSSSRKKKKPQISDVIPYQETISIDDQVDSFIHPDYPVELLDDSEILPDNILSDEQFHYENEFPSYENEHMRGIEQPEIVISQTYYRFKPYFQDSPPIPPVRRQRSSRSLSVSDHESFMEDEQKNRAIQEDHEYIIPTPEPPVRPMRTRSHTRSESRSRQEDDRTSRGKQEDGTSHEQEDDGTSRGADSLTSNNQIEVNEVIEAPCILDIRDASGYAIIDKTKVREPPLPPSRFEKPPKTPPRRRHNKNKTFNSEDKFATVPRVSHDIGPPTRPLRNYSTLRGTPNHLNDDEKENLHVTERLQSGEVIQKMRDRPLPAPPRPPRKSRTALNDVTHEQNVLITSQEDLDKIDAEILHDIEDQIIPYDHEETVTHGSLVLRTMIDSNVLPYSNISKGHTDNSVEHIISITQEYDNDKTIESKNETTDIPDEIEDDDFSVIPEEFSKLKSPDDVAGIEEFDKNTVISEEFPSQVDDSIEMEVNSKQDTKMPQRIENLDMQFTKTENTQTHDTSIRNNNSYSVNVHPEQYLMEDQEVNILRAQKLQVVDLDVDKLRVKELQASKIIVSELDGVSLQVSEINSKCGNLVVSGIDLPPNLIQDMLQRLQMAANEQVVSREIPQEITTNVNEQGDEVNVEQKKTPFEEVEVAPPIPPRYDSKTNLLDDGETIAEEEAPEELALPPTRPPRRSSQVEKITTNTEEEEVENNSNVEDQQHTVNSGEIDEIDLKKTSNSLQTDSAILEKPEILEEPPPRPPEPIITDEDLSPTRLPECEPEIIVRPEQIVNAPKSEDEAPPRPPEPTIGDEFDYPSSQPPPSFFALKSPHLKEFLDEDIPSPPRRKRHHRPPPISMSSSDDGTPAPRRHNRSTEQSIPQLTGQLVRLCTLESECTIKRLIIHITQNVLENADGKQDLHVIILLLLIFIAGLLLLSDPKVTIHQNHWDFFNPPKNL
ncbi:hypothetical protein FQA39_LY12486 [Lamprigera yunnana]|nr:hypothetical protein FQA39_LY12486 [Lamprigera yunnana]